jgi:hypothetical protein
MKPETPSNKVNAIMNNARRCAATVETIKSPSPEVTAANLAAGGFKFGERVAEDDADFVG